jgi:hypothetical protein
MVKQSAKRARLITAKARFGPHPACPARTGDPELWRDPTSERPRADVGDPASKLYPRRPRQHQAKRAQSVAHLVLTFGRHHRGRRYPTASHAPERTRGHQTCAVRAKTANCRMNGSGLASANAPKTIWGSGFIARHDAIPTPCATAVVRGPFACTKPAAVDVACLEVHGDAVVPGIAALIRSCPFISSQRSDALLQRVA